MQSQRGRQKIRMRAILSRFFRRFQILSPSITFTFRCGRGGDLKDAKKLDKSALHLYFFSASDWQPYNITIPSLLLFVHHNLGFVQFCHCIYSLLYAQRVLNELS